MIVGIPIIGSGQGFPRVGKQLPKVTSPGWGINVWKATSQNRISMSGK